MTDWPKQGPASYFPSMEKKYGQPIAHWQGLIRARYPASTWHWWRCSRTSTAWGMGTPTRWWPTRWPRMG